MTQFDDAASAIEAAQNYLELFGPVPANTAAITHVKRMYHQQARLVAPDFYVGTQWHARAENVFKRLADFYQQAEAAAKNGTYGQAPTVIAWSTRRGTHRALKRLPDGDLCLVYESRSTRKQSGMEYDSLCKVSRNPADNDLLAVEAKVLKHLASSVSDDAKPYYPQCFESFEHGGQGVKPRRVNVLARLQGFYTLADVKTSFPRGLPGVHMAWIYRRVLFALLHAHAAGVVHGSLLPQHVMILPSQHGVVLVDWCYASLRDDVSGHQPPLTAIVNDYKDWYPAEVFAKAEPTPSFDLSMAARCMIDLTGGDPLTGNYPVNAALPRHFQAFFKGCLGQHRSAQPDSAHRLLMEFDELLEHLGDPYYPRKFRTFTMPVGTV